MVGMGPADFSGDATHLDAADQAALSIPASFVEVDRVERVPDRVWREFAHGTIDHSSQMANPGKKWQATDVIREDGLPFRRLIFAGVSDSYCVLYFEHGGIGHSYHLILFRLHQDSAELTWRASSMRKVLRGLSEIPDALRSGQLRGDDPRSLY